MKKNEERNISDLLSNLETDLIEDLEMIEKGQLSNKKIKELALEKRISYKKENIVNTKTKKSFPKVAIIAAVVCLFAVTVYAASKTNLFKDFIYQGIEDVEDSIITPIAKDSKNGKTLNLEAMITDGSTVYAVVSLEGIANIDYYSGVPKINDIEVRDLFHVSLDTDSTESYYFRFDKIRNFEDETKQYFALNIRSEQKFNSGTLEVSLTPQLSQLNVKSNLNNKLDTLNYVFDEIISHDVELKEIQITPMGYLLSAKDIREIEYKNNFIKMEIELILKDGIKETITTIPKPREKNPISDDGYKLGSHIYGIGLNGNLVVSRSEDDNLNFIGQFPRIINPNDIIAIKVNGIEYPVE